MPRFHLPPADWPSATLRGDEAKHLTQVLRIKPGATITVFDGIGSRAQAQVLTTSRDQVTLSTEPPTSTPPSQPAITLAQAIPKGKNMDLIVQKAVELGVNAIQPLITANTIVQPGEGKSDKWRRTALEACKQCGQDTIPHIADPLPFQTWITQLKTTTPPTHHLNLIASLAPGAIPLRQLLHQHPSCLSATLLIGPEGDFTLEEIHASLAAGFHPATLGNIVLRVETATLYCISALKYQYSSHPSHPTFP